MKVFTHETCPICLETQRALRLARATYQGWDIDTEDGLAEYSMVGPRSSELPLVIDDEGHHHYGQDALDFARRLSQQRRGSPPE